MEWSTDRVLEALRKGDTAQQIADRYGKSISSVQSLAKRHGLFVRQSAMLGIDAPLGVVDRPRWKGRRKGALPEPSDISPHPYYRKNSKWRKRGIEVSRAANKKLDEIHRYERQQETEKRLGPISDEQKRIAYMKKRHRLVKLGRKYGVRLKD